MTDEGILALRDLNNLKILGCENCKVTNLSVIQLLESSKDLEILNVFQCKTTVSDLIEAARDIVSRRTNGKFLDMFIYISNIDFNYEDTLARTFTFPLLRIY